MTKIKNIMPIVVAVLAAWSCSSRDELQSEQERVPIRLATSLDGTGARTTRAGTTNNVTQSTEFLAGQYVDAYIKVKGGDWLTGLSATTPRHFQVNTTDTNSDGIVDGDLDRKSGEAMDYYPMDATPVTIYAVHPSVASDAAFTVSNNQMDADNYAASDLCYSKTKDYNRTESKQTLKFKHVLSKIVVNVDVSELGTPTVSNLRLKAKTKTSITYPYPSDATNDYQIGSASEVDYIKMNVGGAAIIPPQKTSAVGDVLITFDVAGVGPIAYKFPANTTFASNTQYIYTVKVGGTISVTSTITDWDAGTYSPGDELVMTKNIKMNPLWYVAKGYMTNSALGSSATLTMGTGNTGYFYTWANAMQTFAAQNSTYTDYKTAGKTISEQDGTWHMPVKGEVLSLLPYESNMFALNSDANDIYTTNNVIFGYNSETKTGITDNFYWKNMGSSKGRAIRFLNSEYCSAWEYEVNTAASPMTLTITSCLIGWVDNTKSAASAVYNEIDWANLSSYGTAVQRVFYARGYKDYGTSSFADSYQTTCIAYWSATYSYTESSPGWGDGSWGFECFSHSGYGLFTCKGLRQSAGMNVCMFRDN